MISSISLQSTTRPPPSCLSRPVEHCEGCPALAGIRNLDLDDPSPGRPDSHCNFGGVGGWQTGALYPRRIDLPRPYGGGCPRSRRPATARRSVGGGRGRNSAINRDVGVIRLRPKTAANAVTCENNWWSRLGLNQRPSAVRRFDGPSKAVCAVQSAADWLNWTLRSTCSESLAGYWPDGFEGFVPGSWASQNYPAGTPDDLWGVSYWLRFAP